MNGQIQTAYHRHGTQTPNGLPCQPVSRYCKRGIWGTPMKKCWPSGIFCTSLRVLLPNKRSVKTYILTQTIQKMKKAYLYIRHCPNAPAEKKGGQCLQEKKLRKYCRSQQLEIAGIFSDIAPAANFERPAFKEMFACLENNREGAALLLFHTWDRFSRNPVQAIEMLKHLKGLNISVKAIEEPEPVLTKQA
jgi:Resolvase, N terminal domain